MASVTSRPEHMHIATVFVVDVLGVWPTEVTCVAVHRWPGGTYELSLGVPPTGKLELYGLVCGAKSRVLSKGCSTAGP